MARSEYKSQYCHEEPWYLETAPTGGLLRYRILAIGADDSHIVQASGTAAVIVGLNGELTYDKAEEVVSVIMWSPSQPIRAGAAISVGDLLTSDAEGRAVPAASGNNVVGRATSAATTADELINCFVDPGVAP